MWWRIWRGAGTAANQLSGFRHGSLTVKSSRLPFVIMPLVMFTASRAKLGDLATPRWLSVLAGLIAVIIIGLNMKLIYDVATGVF